MYLCLTISEIADVAQVIIALANVALVLYVFIYTRKKDSKDVLRNLMLQDQSIKLQWFKDLIILPNLSQVFEFYSKTTSISQQFLVPDLTDHAKSLILDEIKGEHSKLRKSFLDVLRVADVNIEKKVKENIDNLIGDISTSIFDKGINLSHPPAFEREIAMKIVYSKNDLISTIYVFKGNISV